jgi:hypothetical protein
MAHIGGWKSNVYSEIGERVSSNPKIFSAGEATVPALIQLPRPPWEGEEKGEGGIRRMCPSPYSLPRWGEG